MPNLNQYLLSDARFFKPLCDQLKKLLKGKILELDTAELKNLTYAAWQQKHSTWPDQIFHGHWRQLENHKIENGWCYSLLDQTARYHLVNDPRRLCVKDDKFNEWQNWISNQSGFPVMALQLSKHLENRIIDDTFELSMAIKEKIGRRCIISPFNLSVEDYINREGLHEAHLHLNGTTLFEQLWNTILTQPNAIIDEMIEAISDPRVELLYASYPFVDIPKELLHILQIARRLRETLLLWLVKEKEYNNCTDCKEYEKSKDNKNCENCKNCKNCENCNYYLNSYSGSCERLGELLSFPSMIDQVSFIEESKRFSCVEEHWTHIEELNWQVKLLYQLKRENKFTRNIVDTCYLLYLQCMNIFHDLFVQRSDQYGFDQFQKFADNHARDLIEKSYKSRFFQLHGPKINERPDITTLEGRFAPKGEQSKNISLTTDILTGFLEYAKGLKPFEFDTDINELAKMASKYIRPHLCLVAHFIKSPWSIKDGGYHFQNKREALDEKAFLLCELLEAHPNLRKIITGIDAAANELESPPEVFAPVYRYCRFRGFKNFTFHTGEDFEHLLSGIRSIYDTIKLLRLQDGDRIGHGTAIGIHPQIWLDAMPDKIYLKQGEWMNDLLFLRKIALENAHTEIKIGLIETKIRELSLRIYNKEHPIEALQEAWNFRGLRPTVINDVLDSPININNYTLNNATEHSNHISIYSLEFELTKKANKRILELLKTQTSDQKVLENNELEIEINLSDISLEVLLEAQQFTQAYVAKQKVVIETLPTSNVRISHYNSIEDHHIFRWLQIPDRAIKGDHKMLFALGSDDPGIFSTDMRNEFYHLFTVLTQKFKYSVNDALTLVSSINENGRIYRFTEKGKNALNETKGLAEEDTQDT